MIENADRGSSPDWLSPTGTGHAEEDLIRLRQLLFGRELRELSELHRRLDALGLTAEEVADRLPDAIALRAGRDKQLARALAPTLDQAFDEAVHRNPGKLSAAIFPVLGPAIRRAISETMAGLVQRINRAFEHSFSWRGLRWRLEAWRTGVPFADIVIKRALVYRVERIFLIHGETGLLLAHVAAEGLETPDADVISGMLTAIKDFVQDSFQAQSDHGLRRMSVAEHSIHAHQGPHAMIAAVVRGAPPESLDERLQAILERVHLQFGDALTHFDGDVAPFESAGLLLDDGLEMKLTTDDARGRGLAPRAVWVGVLLLLVAGGAWYVWNTRRWTSAVAALQRTPGIVVIDASRRWGRWHLTGLVDRDAATPATLLAAMGHDTTDVRASWEPYVSLDPDIVLSRARRILDPPNGVTLILAGDRLVARGRTAPQWLAQTRERAAALAGITALDDTALTLALSDSLAAQVAQVESTLITFALGSSELSENMVRRLDSAATAIADLLPASDREAVTASVELVGRTDTTGTEQLNRVLSEERANAVRAALASRGTPADRLIARGIGTTDPLTGGSPAAEAQRNRSVSLVVHLDPRRVGDR